MKHKSLGSIVAAAAVGFSLAACAPAPQSYVTDQVPVVDSSTEAPGVAYSKENNPFFVSIPKSEISDSFSMLEQPVKDLKGTVTESYLGQMSAVIDGIDYRASFCRPFGWIVLRDQFGETLYLIYPAERVLPKGEEIVVGMYFPFKENTVLSNNKLVSLTSGEGFSQSTSWSVLDFLIQSSAEDGHVDGIIALDSIEYLLPGTGD